MTLVWLQVKRLKTVLSANSDAHISVEELYGGLDFRSSISRVDFEALAGPFFERTAGPLSSLLQRNQLTPDQLGAVEILGGGSRIPGVKAALQTSLQGRPLDT